MKQSLWFTGGRWGLSLVAVFLLSLCLMQPLAAKPSGIVALVKAGQPVPDAILEDPRISGVVVRQKWPDLEPEDGAYRWEYLDQQLKRVTEAGKQAHLLIISGGLFTPDWLMEKGPEVFEFVDRNRFHKTHGDRVAIPLFWDPLLLKHKARLTAAAGKRFAHLEGLTAVSASCANATTDDWNVPAREPEDAEQWRRLGFSAERLIQACEEVIDSTARAFPEQWIKMPVGNVPRRLSDRPDSIARAVIRYGRETYPGRFIAQRHNLSARTPSPLSGGRMFGWQMIYDHRPLVAGQMLWPAVDTRSCRMNGGQQPCDAQVMLRTAGETGVSYGMAYMEIYTADLLKPELQEVITDIGRQLAKGPTESGENRGEVKMNRPDGASRPAFSGRPTTPQAWVNPPRSGRSRHGVEHHTFDSKAIGEPVGFSVYLPPGYHDSDRDYPIVYWLHGKKGNETRGVHIAAFMDQAIRAGDIPETVMVFVNGGQESFYTDARDGSASVESMLIEELMPHVESSFRIRRDRQSRHLQGFSMGGFGALKFAARYPDRFASVATYGGAFLDRGNPPRRGDADAYRAVFDEDLDYFERNSPAYWLAENREQILAQKLRIRVVVGTRDGTRRYNDNLHRTLEELEIPHEYLKLEGVRHVPRQYYEADEGAAFRFAAEDLR